VFSSILITPSDSGPVCCISRWCAVLIRLTTLIANRHDCWRKYRMSGSCTSKVQSADRKLPAVTCAWGRARDGPGRTAPKVRVHLRLLRDRPRQPNRDSIVDSSYSADILKAVNSGSGVLQPQILPKNLSISFADVSNRNCLISGHLIDQRVVYGQLPDSGSERLNARSPPSLTICNYMQVYRSGLPGARFLALEGEEIT
jgi:hypothetical protein